MTARVRQVSGVVTALAAAVVFSVVVNAGQAPTSSPARPAATAGAGAAGPGPSAIVAPGAVPGYRAPRTPWGDPDIQGIWNGNDLQGVPLQRAASVGDRLLLNDDEYRQRVAARDRQVETDNLDFDLEISEKFEAMGAVGGPVSPPPHWLERAKKVSRLSAYLIDPPDGRLPPTTPEAQKRAQDNAERQKIRRSTLQGREADSYTDRSNYDRCISLGPMGSCRRRSTTRATASCRGPAGSRSRTR